VPENRSIGEILRDAEAGRLDRIFAENREPYDFIATTERLFALLDERKIDYVLVGGLAMLQYVDGRNTRDIDLILSNASLNDVPQLSVSTRDRDFARADFDGVQVDILLTTNAIFDFVRKSHATERSFGKLTVRCATPQGLLILKLFALPSLYRQGENTRAAIYEADIAGLLSNRTVDADAAYSVLTPHVLATDIAELRRILAQIESRGPGFSP